MVGSCVWKPGDKHATPKSLIASPAESFEVSGPDGPAPTVCGPCLAEALADKSNLRGLGLEDMFGEVGSFFTLIMDARSLWQQLAIEGAYGKERCHSRIGRGLVIVVGNRPRRG